MSGRRQDTQTYGVNALHHSTDICPSLLHSSFFFPPRSANYLTTFSLILTCQGHHAAVIQLNFQDHNLQAEPHN